MRLKLIALVLLLGAWAVADAVSPVVTEFLPGDSDDTVEYAADNGGRSARYWSISAAADSVHFLVYFRGRAGGYVRYQMAPGESYAWVADGSHNASAGWADSIHVDLRTGSSKARVAMY